MRAGRKGYGEFALWALRAMVNGGFAPWLMVGAKRQPSTKRRRRHTPEAPYAGGAIRRRRHTPEAPYAGGAIRRRRHTPEAPYAGGAIRRRRHQPLLFLSAVHQDRAGSGGSGVVCKAAAIAVEKFGSPFFAGIQRGAGTLHGVAQLSIAIRGALCQGQTEGDLKGAEINLKFVGRYHYAPPPLIHGAWNARGP